MRLKHLFLAGCVLAAGTLLQPAPARAEKVLKFVPQADLKTFDPVFSSQLITINHAYMVYDTLFGVTAKLEPKPQMVSSYTRSADGLTFSFTLRDGLKFQDGTPVLAKDVVQSIRRWGARLAAGQTLMRFVSAIEATAPNAVTITLKQPFGPLLEMLASPDGPVFVMREKDALVDPAQQVQEIVGSGPFIFDKAAWVPGATVVYRKNPDYVPRSEPADGTTGGKVVHVDRVDWVYLPDPITAAQALMVGEVDAIDLPSADVLPLLRANKNVKVDLLDRLGFMGIARANQLIPPFDKPKMRLALLYLAGNQMDHLDAATSVAEDQLPCAAVFMCGAPDETDAGVGPWFKNDAKTNLEIAKRLIQESGYKGERVVIMDPADFPVIHALSLVTAQKLRDAGVNVDVQTQDWGTIASRRAVKDSPDKNPGGWNIFHSIMISGSVDDPLSTTPGSANCDKAWWGWPCDAALEQARLGFLTTATPEQQKAQAAKYQQIFYDGALPYIPLGQILQPSAYRTNVTGVLRSTRFLFWNLDKQ